MSCNEVPVHSCALSSLTQVQDIFVMSLLFSLKLRNHIYREKMIGCNQFVSIFVP